LEEVPSLLAKVNSLGTLSSTLHEEKEIESIQTELKVTETLNYIIILKKMQDFRELRENLLTEKQKFDEIAALVLQGNNCKNTSHFCRKTELRKFIRCNQQTRLFQVENKLSTRILLPHIFSHKFSLCHT
jgi:hypothetical protein